MSTIRSAITTSIAANITVMGIALAAVATYFALDAVNTTALDNMTPRIHNVRAYIVQRLKSDISTLTALASAPALHDPSLSTLQKAEAIAYQLPNLGSGARYFVVSDNNGYGNTSIGGNCQIARRHYFQSVMAAQPAIDGPIISQKGDMTIYAAVPINDRDGAPNGCLAINLNAQLLNEFAQQLSLGSASQTFIIQRSTGTIIQSSDSLLNNGHSNFEKLALDKSGYEDIARIANHMMRGEMGAEVISYLGERQYVAYAPIELTDWAIGVHVPTSTYTNVLYDMAYSFLGITLVFILIGSLFGAWYASHFSKPIRILNNRMVAVAKGDLVVGPGEQAELEHIMRRHDELGKIGVSLRKMLEELTSHVQTVREIALGVRSKGDQMNAASSQVSSCATEQAASMEQMSSSMLQMTANIRSSADNAQATNQFSQEASSKAEQGGEAVKRAGAAVLAIDEKLKVIDDIAAQTGILALNASIEASRAGAAGEGFAVVAEQVQKLANTSMDAVQQIGDAMQELSANANEVEVQIAGVVPNVEKTAHLIEAIATSSREQGEGAQQITSALTQLDGIVQQNAAAAEQMAAMSVSLNDEAQKLVDAVSFFKIPRRDAFSGPQVDQRALRQGNIKKPVVEHKPTKADKLPGHQSIFARIRHRNKADND